MQTIVHPAPLVLISDCLIFRVDKDTRPGCGVEDYVNTWNDFYDAANLKETYNFLSPQSAPASYGQASFAGRQGLREISPANLTDRAAWSPLAEDFHIDRSQPRSDRDPTSSVVRCRVEPSSPVVPGYDVAHASSLLCHKDTAQGMQNAPLCLSLCLYGNKGTYNRFVLCMEATFIMP